MDIALTSILGSVNNFGPIAVLVGLAFFVAYKGVKMLEHYLSGRIDASRNDYRVARPSEHAFFSACADYLSFGISIIRFYHHGTHCKARDVIFRKMLELKITAWRDGALRMCSTDICKLSATELQYLNRTTSSEINQKYYADWEAAGIPQIVIERFNSWHASRTKAVMDAIDSIALGRSYRTNQEKQNAIMDVHLTLLRLTIQDAQDALGSLNGELSGSVFNGLKLE